MQLNHDSSGFLVGERLSAEDITGRLDAIRDELRALRKDIGNQSHAERRPSVVAGRPVEVGSAPVSPSSQAKTEASTPRRDEIVVRINRDNDSAAVSPDRQRDLGQYVFKQAIAPNSTSAYAPFNSGAASAVSPGNASGPTKAPEQVSGSRPQPLSGRDASGRFVAKDGTRAPSDEGGGDGLLIRSVNEVGDRMAAAVREMGAGSEEADPTIKAFNEVAEPLSRGFGKIMGDSSDRKQERWYRRFWSMMRGSRREDREEGKQQNRILKNIERKPVGGDGGSMLWRGIMLLLAPITGMLSLLGGLPIALAGAVIAGLKGLLTALGMGRIARRMTIPGSGRSTSQRGGSSHGGAARSAAGVGAGQRQQNGGPRASATHAGNGGSGRGVGRLLKGGVRGIPGIGALLGLGFMASDVAASEGGNATRAEKDTMTGRAVGGGVGGIAGVASGAAAGAALGSVVPVIGTAVGGIVGAIAGGYFGGSAGETIGEEVGGWVTDLRQSNLVSTLAQRWEYTTTFMSSLWSQASEGVAARWNHASTFVSSLWSQTSEGVAARWGVATDTFQGLWDSSTAKFNSTWESLSGSLAERWASVTDEMKGVWSGAVSIAAEGWSTLTDAMGGVNDWIAEKTGVDIGQATRDAGEWVSDRATESTEWVAGRAEAAADRVEEATSWLGSKISAGASWLGEKSGVSAAVDAVRNAHNEASATPALTRAMADAGITDVNEQAAFMGQMHHESGGFRTMEESFNYSSADRIMAVSRTARNQGPEAVEAAMAQGPEAVAELMYGGRMGNTEPGDGYRYRGRGFTQLTGRDNYTAASEALGVDLVNNPDMAADPEIAAKVATWYWQSRDGLSEAAQRGDTREVTRLINGGDNGLAEREAATSEYLAAAQAGELTASDSEPEPSGADRSPTTTAANLPPSPRVDIATAHLDTYLETLGLPSKSPALGVSASAPASIPPLRVPQVTEAPAVSIPLSSGGDRSNGQQASRAPQDVSRDLSDRRIAHIVTGSYSAPG